MKTLFSLWRKYSFLLLIAFVILSLFDLRFAVIAVICMFAPIAVSLFKGRYWCGNFCPRGNFYDNIVSRFSNNKPVPKFLKSTGFRIFMVVFMMGMFSFGIKQNWGNLYGIGMVIYRLIVVTTVVGIVLSLFFHQRTWCNFCPMGTIASWVSHLRKSNRVLKISDSCVSCGLCEKKCPLGIVPYDYKGDLLSHPDCIQCGKCAAVCPKKAIGYH